MLRMLLFSLLISPALANPLPGDAELAEISTTIQQIRSLVRAAGSQGLRSEVGRRLADLEAQVDRLDRARFELIDQAALVEGAVVSCYHDRPPQRTPRYRLHDPIELQAPPAPPPPPEPISADELRRIKSAVDAGSFSRDQLDTLRSAARDRYFTVDQVRQVMGWFNFGKDKVEAAAILHPHVIDSSDWYQVYSSLNFESDKRALRQKIGD